jgi:hypothetical protein
MLPENVPAPSIGRIVLVKRCPGAADDQKFAAIVTNIAADDFVVLTVFPPNGQLPFAMFGVMHESMITPDMLLTTPSPPAWVWPDKV